MQKSPSPTHPLPLKPLLFGQPAFEQGWLPNDVARSCSTFKALEIRPKIISAKKRLCLQSKDSLKVILAFEGIAQWRPKNGGIPHGAISNARARGDGRESPGSRYAHWRNTLPLRAPCERKNAKIRAHTRRRGVCRLTCNRRNIKPQLPKTRRLHQS